MPTVSLDTETNRLVADGDLDKAAVTVEGRLTLDLESGTDYQLDLSGLQRFDSAGLAYIINLINKHSLTGGTIRLLNSPEQVLQLIELSEVDDVISLVSD